MNLQFIDLFFVIFICDDKLLKRHYW